ncbi:MAG: FG-GAP-like repeat-containing protein [Verrucomicrobiales bacterium]
MGCILSWMLGASVWGQEEIVSDPLSAVKPASGKGFVALSGAETGIEFENTLLPEHLKKYLYFGAGGCAGDFDGDGQVDLYLVSEDGKNRLFRQVSPWHFEDVTDRAGVDGGESWGAGATFVDIDNDGDLDLYVCNMGSPNLLYINKGNGLFVEEAARWGLDYNGATWMASFADYDRDGDLDCYLLTYRLSYIGEGNPKFEVLTVDGKPAAPPHLKEEFYFIEGRAQEAGRKDLLLRNEGNGSFSDVSEASGIGVDLYHGLSATWWDFDRDGWLDLYVANDFQDPDRLWHNNGDGTFTDVFASRTACTSWFSMGSDYGDLNRDGWLDFFVADMSATTHYRQKMEMGEMGRNGWFLDFAEPRQLMRNMVFINAGGRRFLETGSQSGLESTGWTWAARLADLDCDGWEDAIVSNGMIRDVNNSDHLAELDRLDSEGMTEERERLIREYGKPGFESKKVYRNRGDLTFEDKSTAWNYQTSAASYGLILADFDRDGDLDVVTNDLNQKAEIFRNDLPSGHRMLVKLRGRKSNSRGIGATVRVKSQSGWQTRLLTPAHGYLSADEPALHFGFGDDPVIERLEIDWPSGVHQTLTGLKPGFVHTIIEPDEPASPGPAVPVETPAPPGLFDAGPISGLTFAHVEDTFDDFATQPLLPWKLSRLGPGIAFGDANGDGEEDLWVGGASWQSGRLFLHQAGGEWAAQPWGPWEKHETCEDMGAVFFDPDGDGDLDLYVASGGNRTTILDRTVLEDRLYINTGKDGFAPAIPDADPTKRAFESSGVVAAADFDRDGDVDLFVGSRVTAEHFDQTPRQRLLRNDGEHLEDVTDQMAPGLRDAGRVTGALWSDVDSDGSVDLLVAVAWGPVKLFRQESDGKFVDRTREAGLADAMGWWQGIAGGDLDGDGDMDCVVTNLGRNTKYHGSADHPVSVYLNDFDGDGKCDVVEAEYEGNTLVPMRGRSCSSQAMPFIREKFKTFDAFAKADLGAIYNPRKLEISKVLTLNFVDSVALLNDGTGRFTPVALPTLAQTSPGFGVVVQDFDGDGIPDVVLAQNFYSPQRETGRMCGGLGLFLRGRGNGSFDEVPALASGIWMPGDSKSLAVGDLNDDGAPDLVCAANNGPIVTLVNRSGGQGVRWTTLQLDAGRGNPTGIGSRAIVETDGGRKQTLVVGAGGGYLSQSSSRLLVGLKGTERVAKVVVRWPGGATTEHLVSQQTGRLRINAKGETVVQ